MFLSVIKMLEYNRVDVSAGIAINKADEKNNVCFVIIGILKILVTNLNQTFVMVFMMY